MKATHSVPMALALLLMASCGSKSSRKADAPSTTSGAPSVPASSAPSADIPTHSQTATPDGPAVTFDAADDLMLHDLALQPDGKAYYRGHPFNGSVWIGLDRVVRRTFSNGVATITKAYHSTGAEAATFDARGHLKDCRDTEGQSISVDDFRQRYPDLYTSLRQFAAQ